MHVGAYADAIDYPNKRSWYRICRRLRQVFPFAFALLEIPPWLTARHVATSASNYARRQVRRLSLQPCYFNHPVAFQLYVSTFLTIFIPIVQISFWLFRTKYFNNFFNPLFRFVRNGRRVSERVEVNFTQAFLDEKPYKMIG